MMRISLRSFTPATKFIIGLSLAFCVTLPLLQGLIIHGATWLLLLWAGIGKRVLQNLRKLVIPLGIIFIINTLVRDSSFAFLITLRFVNISLSLLIFTMTMEVEELFHIFIRLKIPVKISFAIVSGMNSIETFKHEWHRILVAQRLRGVSNNSNNIVEKIRHLNNHIVPLITPAIVLSVKRAWSLSEAATLRGFYNYKPPVMRRNVSSTERFFFIFWIVFLMLLFQWERFSYTVFYVKELL